jgi:hypothetical protein
MGTCELLLRTVRSKGQAIGSAFRFPACIEPYGPSISIRPIVRIKGWIIVWNMTSIYPLRLSGV